MLNVQGTNIEKRLSFSPPGLARVGGGGRIQRTDAELHIALRTRARHVETTINTATQEYLNKIIVILVACACQCVNAQQTNRPHGKSQQQRAGDITR